MNKRWTYRPEPDAEVVEKLAAQINVSTPIASILVQRGICTFDDAKAFFRPELSMLHDPFLMQDMDKAVTRLIKAFRGNEKIMVYGDYDVDGTTSVALFYGFINSFHVHSTHYIPDRYKEGYGISKKGIDTAHEKGITLIVSLDCGIKSVELVAYAKSLGIDFIICDHHLPGEVLPDAVAVLDPKRPDCHYPFKELPGCGIGYKLVEALCNQLDELPVQPENYLDLVAVAIASDIVPIVGENRILAYHGLRKLNRHPRPGLQALMRLAHVQKELNITGVVFGLAPRINAAGRISHANGAVDLLLAESEEEAYHFAGKLHEKNETRRDVDSTITKEALEMIANSEQLELAKTTVLYKDSWHKGVIGIVASRCIETYYRPTIIMTASEGKATGSARSVPGFDIHAAIERCSDLLDHFGGHKYAAGLTMDIEKIAVFQERFEQIVAANITEELLTPQVVIDTDLELTHIRPKFLNIINQMEPFGPENMAPVFSSERLSLAGSLKVIKDKHLKFVVRQEGSPSKFECIAFGLAHLADQLQKASDFNMAYCIEENEFRGVKSIQLNVKDIKFD